MWDNTTVVNGDLLSEIKKINGQTGKDIIVYGGAVFVSSWIKEKLIDGYHLFVNPAVIGKGVIIFQHIEKVNNLTLLKSKSFNCGIIFLCYEPKQN